jgi:hypothetical protein
MPRKRRASTPSTKDNPGVEALRAFMRENGDMKVTAVARALGITHVAVIGWLRDERPARPDCWIRKLIAKWTKGAVPEEIWLTEDQRKRIAEQPIFPRGRTNGTAT